MQRFKALDLRVETKPDLTPVSDADKATEELLRTTLSRSRPRDAVLGEEYGDTPGNSGGTVRRRWVIDPIDGTKNFVRRVPVWATLIALLQDGVPVKVEWGSLRFEQLACDEAKGTVYVKWHNQNRFGVIAGYGC